MSSWREHVEHSVALLDQAQGAANTPAILDYLYQSIVATTRAICELEEPRDESSSMSRKFERKR